MGFENMRRRWPLYIFFVLGILLVVSLLNSQSMETELRNKIGDISSQLQECSKHQTTCAEDSLALIEKMQILSTKVGDLEKQKVNLDDQVLQYKTKVSKSESKTNQTLVDVELCKTELQSLKNLQVSKSATLETLRLEKETLTTQLEERKKKISELEKEVAKLKADLAVKSVSVAPVPGKVTPAAQPPKLSPPLNVHNPINEPVLENDAKEDIEDGNLNDQDFDQQL